MTLERLTEIQRYLSGDSPLPPIEVRRMAVELEEELHKKSLHLIDARAALREMSSLLKSQGVKEWRMTASGRAALAMAEQEKR